jgi:hypothetical protein
MGDKRNVSQQEAEAHKQEIISLAIRLNNLLEPGISLNINIPRTMLITSEHGVEYDVIHISKPLFNVDVFLKK